MRAFKGLGPLLLIGIAGLALMFFLSEPGAKWLTEKFTPPPPSTLVVGRIVHLEGHLNRIIDGQVTEVKAPLVGPLEIHDGERVEVSKGGRALVILSSLDEFEFGSLSSVHLQLWNSLDPASPIYLGWLAGPVELRKMGVKGKAYVVKDGRLYLPGQRPVQKAMALTVLRAAPLDMTLAESQPIGDADAFEGSGEEDENGGGERKTGSFGAEPETLSNEYIDEVIATRQAQFQKCWLSKLKDEPNLKGKIVVQFLISKRGRVREPHISDSTLADETLKKCVTQVIERLQFRSFSGAEISLTYPISFE
jgi:hypothetical protein